MKQLAQSLATLQSIWPSLDPGQKDDFTGKYFLSEFFSLCPAAKKKFEEKKIDVETHTKKLIETFNFAFDSSTATGALVGALTSIGEAHAEITPMYYYFVIVSFLIALRKFMGDAWTEEIGEDAFCVLEFVSQAMQKGAAEKGLE